MTDEEKKFKAGFNHGYILTAHEPELTNTILRAAHASKGFSEYAYGLSAGHDMYIVDHLEHIDTPKEEKSKPFKELEKLDTPEKKYIKGFNVGYELANHDPELLSKIVKLPNEKSDYFQGMQAGKKQFSVEKMKEKVKGMIQPEQAPKKTKNIGKSK